MNKLLLIIIIAFVSCKSSNDKKTESKSDKLNQFRVEVDSIINKKLNSNEPGVAVLISYDGQMLIGKGYGIKDLESKEKINKSTNFEIASVSKQFTALAILSLVEEGKISLDDTVYKFFPYDTFKNVTIQQLINHTSGIDDAEEAFHKDWDSTKVANNNDILSWYSKENRKKNKAGQLFKYNNGAYELLPLLVEKISGSKFEDYIKANVFEKAEMKRTNIYNLNHPIKIDERAFYYHKDSLGNWNKMDGHHLTGLLGAGGVYTNVNDYFNYDNALRNSSIYSQEIHNLIFEKNDSIKTDVPDMSYSMGWYVNDSTALHTGGWFGVNTFTKRYLKLPLTIACFANTDDFFNKNLVSKVDSLALKFVNKNYR